MKEFCCPRFESRNLVHNEAYPNIRIIKVKPINKTHEWYVPPKNLDESKLEKSLYRFFVTCGYEGEFGFNLPAMNINYCPFCGTNLFDFYKSDEFVNEVQGVTFSIDP